jgi:hypothetical protein
LLHVEALEIVLKLWKDPANVVEPVAGNHSHVRL